MWKNQSEIKGKNEILKMGKEKKRKEKIRKMIDLPVR